MLPLIRRFTLVIVLSGLVAVAVTEIVIGDRRLLPLVGDSKQTAGNVLGHRDGIAGRLPLCAGIVKANAWML